MSLRYVWGKYTISHKTTYISQFQESALSVGRFDDDDDPDPIVASTYSINQQTGQYVLSGQRMSITDDNMHLADIYTYRYMCMALYGTGVIDYTTLYDAGAYGESGDYNWYRHGVNHAPQDMQLDGYRKPDRAISSYKLIPRQSTIQGSFVSDISNTNRSQYPTNGVFGSNWYVYQGSDNIDPISLTVPQPIRFGQLLQLSIEPSASKVYNGNISYRYQVNRNGSGWTDIQASTPNTSISYQVPSSTALLQFRVQASDDLGFTSTDWITSDQIEVIQLSENAHMLHMKKADGTYENMWLETDTEIVIRPDGTTLKDTLADIESRLSGLGV